MHRRANLPRIRPLPPCARAPGSHFSFHMAAPIDGRMPSPGYSGSLRNEGALRVGFTRGRFASYRHDRFNRPLQPSAPQYEINKRSRRVDHLDPSYLHNKSNWRGWSSTEWISNSPAPSDNNTKRHRSSGPGPTDVLKRMVASVEWMRDKRQ
jgi:hypothetical protein